MEKVRGFFNHGLDFDLSRHKLVDLLNEMWEEINCCEDKGYRVAYRQALININGSINGIKKEEVK